MTDVRGIDFHKKRRRVTKASLTKLSTKLTKLETDTTNPELTIHVQLLISILSPSTADGLSKITTRHLTRLQEKLTVIEGAVSAIPEDRDDDDSACTLEQYADQITDLKAELKDSQTRMLNLELVVEDPIIRTQDEIEQTIFQCSVAIRKGLRALTDATTCDTPTP